MSGRLAHLPGVALARSYHRAWLGRDVAAGLAITGILVPAGMAYAEASGLPAIAGLYATVAALLAYALVGPSRILLLGPDSSLVPLVLAALAPFAALGAGANVEHAALLALLVGGLLLAAGVARMGFVADLLSMPVRVGFMTGIALIILLAQLPRLLGIEVPGQSVVERSGELLSAIRAGDTNLTTLAIGVACIATIVACRRWLPRVPGALVAVVGATLVSGVLDLATRAGVAVVGTLPQGLPLPRLPHLSLDDALTLLPAAAGIALVTAADTVILSRTFAARHGHPADASRELIATGVANLAAGSVAGYPVSSSASRTAAAEASGARTQVTGVVGALAICALLVVAPGLLRALPESALAAVVVVAAAGLVDLPTFGRLWQMRPTEGFIALVTFLGVALVGVVPGILLAVGLSLLAFLARSWRPHDAILGRASGVKGYHDLTFYPEARQIPGLVLYRFDAPLLFFNGEAFRQRVAAAVEAADPAAKWVIVAAEPITDVDTTAAEALALLVEELRARGVTLAFAELKDPVKGRLRTYGTLARIGERSLLPDGGHGRGRLRDRDGHLLDRLGGGSRTDALRLGLPRVLSEACRARTGSRPWPAVGPARAGRAAQPGRPARTRRQPRTHCQRRGHARGMRHRAARR